MMKSILLGFIIASRLIAAVQSTGYTCYGSIKKSYKFYEVAQNFGGAYRTCKSDNASLAMPLNEEEVKILVEIFKMYPIIEDVDFMNLFTVGFHGIFTAGEYISLKGEPMEFFQRKWSSGEPNYSSTEKCITIDRDGLFWDTICDDRKHAFICEKDEIPREERFKSKDAYSFSLELRKSYRLHMDPRTWGDARTICDAEGAHLAIIASKAEEDHLLKMLNDSDKIVSYLKTSDLHAFIGFHSLYQKGYYITVKDKELYDTAYINWSSIKSVNTAKRCGGLHAQGGIGNFDCDEKSVFICEKSGF